MLTSMSTNRTPSSLLETRLIPTHHSLSVALLSELSGVMLKKRARMKGVGTKVKELMVLAGSRLVIFEVKNGC